MIKSKITEIIDSDNNIISNDKPMYGPNRSTEANKTTDDNLEISHQQFSNNFFGIFGFNPGFIYEDDDNVDVSNYSKIVCDLHKHFLAYYMAHPEDLKKDFDRIDCVDFSEYPVEIKKMYDDWGKKIRNTKDDEFVTETLSIEDAILDKPTDNSITTSVSNSDDVIDISKIKKVTELISCLDTDTIDNLIKVLEQYNKNE